MLTVGTVFLSCSPIVRRLFRPRYCEVITAPDFAEAPVEEDGPPQRGYQLALMTRRCFEVRRERVLLTDRRRPGQGWRIAG